jgi:hypothetical protein
MGHQRTPLVEPPQAIQRTIIMTTTMMTTTSRMVPMEETALVTQPRKRRRKSPRRRRRRLLSMAAERQPNPLHLACLLHSSSPMTRILMEKKFHILRTMLIAPPARRSVIWRLWTQIDFSICARLRRFTEKFGSGQMVTSSPEGL